MTRSAVIEAALRLPQKQRGQLVDRLIESLKGPADSHSPAEWLQLIRQRVAQVRAGKTRSKPLEQVVAEVRRKNKL